MSRSLLGALLAAVGAACLVLAGCPLPQPLASVSHEDGGVVAVSPPRIVVSTVDPAATVIAVNPTNCPAITVRADVIDENTDEDIVARWFVDYNPLNAYGILAESTIPHPDDRTQTLRSVPSFEFRPPDYSSSGSLHVVELVVSNGFAASGDAVALPNRSALPGYETQVFRWVFQFSDQPTTCGP